MFTKRSHVLSFSVFAYASTSLLATTKFVVFLHTGSVYAFTQ